MATATQQLHQQQPPPPPPSTSDSNTKHEQTDSVPPPQVRRKIARATRANRPRLTSSPLAQRSYSSASSTATTPATDSLADSNGAASGRPRAIKRPLQGNGAPRKRHYLSRPNCTHINMVRIYGYWHVCHICRRTPSLGFLYSCEQDPIQIARPSDQPQNGHQTSLSTSLRRFLPSSLPGSTKELDTRGLSAWIVDAASKGHYTHEQLKKLITQKINVRNMILLDEIKNERDSPGMFVDKLSRLGLCHLARRSTLASADAKTSQLNTSKDPHKGDGTIHHGAVCDFKVCHNCRPVSRDRAVISFEAVFNNEVVMPKEWHPFTMPVATCAAVRQFGMPLRYVRSDAEREPDFVPFLMPHIGRQAPPPCAPFKVVPVSNEAGAARETGDGESVHDKSQPSSDGFRSSLRKSLIDLLQARQSSITSDQGMGGDQTLERNDSKSALDLALARLSLDESIRSLEERGRDLDLWRALAAEQQRTAAAVRLPGEDDSSERLDLDEKINQAALGSRSKGQVRLVSVHDPSSGKNALDGLQKSLDKADDEDAAKRVEQASMDITEVAEGERLIRSPGLTKHNHDKKSRKDNTAFGLGVTMTEEAVRNHDPDFIIASV